MTAASTPMLCMVGDGPDRVPLEQRAHELGVVRDTVSSSVTRRTSHPSTRPSTRWCCRPGTRERPSASSRRSRRERPVVATRVGGVPDVVRDGEDGFLVEAGATDDLADRLGRLARDPELRARMGDEGPRAGAAALRRRAARRRRRRALQVAAQCGRRAKTLNDGFFLPAGRQETGLPADADVRVVAQHEPHHQVDPRVRTGDRVRLTHVGRLSRERNAEQPVGRCLPRRTP